MKNFNEQAMEQFSKMNAGDKMAGEKFYEMCYEYLNNTPIKKTSIKKDNLFFADWSREDYIQETLFLVLKSIETFDPGRGTLSNWLDLKKETTYDRKYKEKKKEGDILSIDCPLTDDADFTVADTIPDSVDLERDAEKNALMGEVKEWVQSLPENRKRAIELLYLEERTTQEVCNMMDCNPNNAYIWKNRGIESLRKIARSNDYRVPFNDSDTEKEERQK